MCNSLRKKITQSLELRHRRTDRPALEKQRLTKYSQTTLSITSNAAKIKILVHRIPFRSGLLAVVSTLIASISAAEPQPFLAGKITSIGDDGTVLLESGSHFYLWGLKLTNHTDARNLLIGRNVFCRRVANLDQDISADCELLPRNDNPANLRSTLNLLVWLVDFRLAAAECSDLDLNISKNTIAGPIRYRCSNQRLPQRSEAEERYPELPY